MAVEGADTAAGRAAHLRKSRPPRSGGVPELLEPCVGIARSDLAEVDEHDRVSLVQFAHRAVDGVAV